MNFSAPFILRPIGTTLLAAGLFLLGATAYFELPVASLPAVDFPTLRVQASRPGADPQTMAATIAAPIERRLGEIAGVTELTSVSSQGSASISVQFDLSRDIDGAARDVQAALNAAAADLPGDLPEVPTFRKYNPSAAPVLILAMTSKSMTPSAIYDAADTVVAQRISQVPGVAQVEVTGAEQPAIRVRVNPTLLASMGLSMEEVRSAIAAANAVAPVGVVDGDRQTMTIDTNTQLRDPKDYGAIVLKTSAGNVVRLSSVASVEHGSRNTRSIALFDRQPAVLLIIRKQPEANVLDTVDGVKALLPNLQRWIPAGIEIQELTDRTKTIRASVHDMQFTLLLAIALVMMVVFVFLRRMTPTVAAGVTVPLSLAGTCAAMWLLGFSINNLTLMAFAIAVGFVVDDAIVMLENIHRNIEKGMAPMRAALIGARQIGFTVISISVSLIAAFIPVLFMGGVAGRMLREFSVTLVVAIAVSVVVSLSVTPMLCAHYLKAEKDGIRTRFDRMVEGILGAMVSIYARTLRVALRHQAVTLFSLVCVIVLTAHLYVQIPKGLFPEDDTGLIIGSTEASADISFEAMLKLHTQALDIILSDPAVEHVGSSIGGSGRGPGGSGSNRGRMFINLKPLDERSSMSTTRVINRMRDKLANINGLEVRMFASRDIRVGARQGNSQYQYTLWDPDLDELNEWAPKVLERMKQIPGIVDVSTDRQAGGLQLDVKIDRDAAARLGVRITDIDSALNNAFSQRQISTIYAQRNQYRVILEVDPRLQRDPSDLQNIYVPSVNGGAQVPLTGIIRIAHGTSPLVVNHQGPFPAVTLSYNLAPGNTLDQALRDIDQAMAEMHVPAGLRGETAGDARAFAEQASQQPLLILAALIAVYIVLGVLYESLAHPLTIISTLPSAGLGALLALYGAGMELSMTALIGVILLIGIVKKNGIMLVDFALDGERQRGLKPAVAIYEACLVRFRPILMTTLAALLGAIPLAIAVGPGSEIRRPLGITIIGGLIVSQMLTLYTTPVIYLLLDRLHRRLGGAARPEADAIATGEPSVQPR
ncbi:MAG: efflux RND transporter permease subunit [Hyphomicrobium sp.]|uniref:efflux RND transporter permease subunit n=1 Tax=Hyphomicrobium sp. TaxID=82 RepID=UPI0013240891|nr:efflux RND transporter permease subunit [Hyphomicrobium sp.]KAB2942627.1 MAG: acriflavine resistance protein B [Hyphomicrobium sp.]MBZ0208611.1 efflux RND transporter permease subunit [Hyphomicrobium sp.]